MCHVPLFMIVWFTYLSFSVNQLMRWSSSAVPGFLSHEPCGKEASIAPAGSNGDMPEA